MKIFANNGVTGIAEVKSIDLVNKYVEYVDGGHDRLERCMLFIEVNTNDTDECKLQQINFCPNEDELKNEFLDAYNKAIEEFKIKYPTHWISLYLSRSY